VIYATAEEEGTVESMLHKIDIIPLQVRIDATIAEVDLNDKLQYGTQFFFQNQGLTGALTQGGLANNAPNSNSFEAIAGTAGFLLSKTNGAVRTAIQALQDVSNVRVLSSPQLMVLDNQTAMLQVGDSIPFNTGSLTSSAVGGIPATATTTSYQQTGVIMQILPHVNSSGLVTLDIGQEVSEVDPTVATVAGSPAFLDRKVTTRIAVQDGQTIGIAGLITDQASDDNSGIPFLKDIPILGTAFSFQNNVRTRRELLVMITPHVIQDQRDAMRLTQDLRENLPGAGLVPQQLKDLPVTGSPNPNADLTN
jgi:general secretion pathway protein D